MTEYLTHAEVYLHVLALVAYAAASMSAIAGVFTEKSPLLRWADRLALTGLVFHTAGLVARWVAIGHGPYVSRYEVLSANAWVVLVLYLWWSHRTELMRPFSVVVYPAVLLLMGLGVYMGPEVHQLPPTFSGIWLALHVAFYFVAFSVGLLTAAISLVIVADKRLGRFRARFPSEIALDRAVFRFAGLAFAFWGIGMLTGSVWAYYSWGRFWGWDPVETWSLVTWVTYGVYLHLRRMYGWRQRRAAILMLVCFGLAVGTLFFTSLINGSLHAVYFR
ncbi:MAG: cytochrome c biogenesis protein CcsA [Coriobacteriia bacterium]|nr:cytochrome c biogenesis protein CcsA [Coriobacteriia bacterium]